MRAHIDTHSKERPSREWPQSKHSDKKKRFINWRLNAFVGACLLVSFLLSVATMVGTGTLYLRLMALWSEVSLGTGQCNDARSPRRLWKDLR